MGRTKSSVPPKLKLSNLKKGELLQLLRDDDDARIAAAAASPDDADPRSGREHLDLELA